MIYESARCFLPSDFMLPFCLCLPCETASGLPVADRGFNGVLYL